MRSTKENAAAIRIALKAEGYNARRVSIKTEYYSMGSSIHATIRDSAVDAVRVKEIVKTEGERIHRCEATGDILSGGNCFVYIHYTDAVRKEFRALHAEAVGIAMAKVDANDTPPTLLHDVPGFSNVVIGRGDNGWGYSLWIDNSQCHGYVDTAEEMSMGIATDPRTITGARAKPEPTPTVSESMPNPEPDATTLTAMGRSISDAIARAMAADEDSPLRNSCSNCDQWQDKTSGDCINRCAKRGFATFGIAQRRASLRIVEAPADEDGQIRPMGVAGFLP